MSSVAITNARIWTGNPRQPRAEAVAISGDRIAAVGSLPEIERLLSHDTQVIDGRGRLVVPGLTDSHLHFITGGMRLTSVQLRDATTKQDFVGRIRAFAARLPKGAWIQGGDWDHTRWGGELPDRRWIDAQTPDNPVWVNRLDGHMALANSAALATAGINRSTGTPSGGEIMRDARGEPTGILKDNAMSLIESVVPDPTTEELDRALDAACVYVAARGVTSVHHMGTWSDLEMFRRARSTNRLRTRVYAAVPLHTWGQLREFVTKNGRGDERLHWGALKGFVDGSLGSRTAAFLEPYSDAPAQRGLFVNRPEELYNWTTGAAGAGFQVVVHAIGDRAIRTQLDNYEQATREHYLEDARFRIEHAQHIAPADIPRFAKLRVIASMQPYHCIDDGRWAEPLIGAERAKTTYAFRSQLETGARLAFGSDWYVAPPTPLEGIYAAVTRSTLDGKHPDGWVPEQKITVEQALNAYTRDAAFAEFAENDKGTLEPGKLADLVMIDRDLFDIPPHEIRDAKIVATIVGGEIVYSAMQSAQVARPVG